MSPGKMEIRLSSMTRKSYQAMITVMNMVSMSHISTCASLFTMCMHSYCWSCQCVVRDLIFFFYLSLLDYDKIEFGDGILFDSQNPRIEMQRSYKCDRNQSFNGTSELTNITATLNVTGFQVQVFQFHNNASNGTFDNGKLILTPSLYHVLILLFSLV